MSFEELTLFVWDESGTQIHDPLFLRATSIKKASQYPGGVYGTASFVLPRDIIKNPSRLRAGYQVRLWDQGAMIYHGFVEGLEDVRKGQLQGTKVSCVGAWGWIMEKRGIERNWADTRISADVWKEDTTTSGAELGAVDRKDRMRITPKAETWTNGNVFTLSYQTPTDETVGKITNDYELAESAGANDWELELYNGIGTEWSIITSSTGSQDVDLGTGVAKLNLYARDTQTPTADGTYFGEVSNVTVFAGRDSTSGTPGNMNAYELGLDVVDLLGVDTTLISSSIGSLDSSLTTSVIPFISNGHESFASQIARIAGAGDASNKPVGFGLRSPFESGDDRPELFLESYPDETDYEYEASAVELGLSLRLNVDDVWNYIVIEYEDVRGETQTITPGDNANLEDTDSQALYGVRRKKIILPGGSYAVAYGIRFLNRHKNPPYAVTKAIKVERLRAKGGGWVRASKIDAGQRIRFVDLPDVTDQNGVGGVTLLITKTDYDHDAQQVTVSVGGRPDDLGLWLAGLVDQLPN